MNERAYRPYNTNDKPQTEDQKPHTTEKGKNAGHSAEIQNDSLLSNNKLPERLIIIRENDKNIPFSNLNDKNIPIF
jgi:hypothetical protein